MHRPLLCVLFLTTTLVGCSRRATSAPAAPRSLGAVPSRPTAQRYLSMPPNQHGRIPAFLSQTGAFKDVRSLVPSDALIPYELNVPFWSDGAVKQRWISLPSTDQGRTIQIRFSAAGEWSFPPGTVFVKHFESPASAAHPQPTRLETRLLICDEMGGVYGVSYRWRADQSDADLVTESTLARIESRNPASSPPRTWYFPGPADCRVCHTPTAGLVLGVKMRQLNRDLLYPATRRTENQLIAWHRLGLFNPPFREADLPTFGKLVPADDPRAPLDTRARSYLDANCAHCHRPGGAAGQFDARFDTPLPHQNLIEGPVLINLGMDRARVIAPKDVNRSILLARVNTLEQTKMPPLAHEVIDTAGVELLSQWINSLPGSPVLQPPTLEPAGGEFRSPVRVSIRHADPLAEIRYTIDGSVPNKSSAVYRLPLTIAAPTTLRAKAFKDGVSRSITVQETYIVEPP